MNIPITEIEIPERQRKDYGEVEELATSLKEYGQMQPILLTKAKRLIAGGRRLAAAKSLGWTDIKATFFEDAVNEGRLQELELEENIRRKDLNWQERAYAIAKIHELKAREDHHWGYKETGELVGRAVSNVHNLCSLVKEMQSDERIRNAPTYTAAWTILLKKKEDDALRLLAQRQPVLSVTEPGSPVLQTDETSVSVDLDKLVHHGSCLDLMQDFRPDHIVTDPPYAIDMDMLAQTNQSMARIDSVENEHDVTENIDLLSKFLQAAHAVVKGYVIMWCDPMWFRWIVDIGTEAGFHVQRWPFVWIKTTPCKNSAANYNFTKSFEFAAVMRKDGATLVRPQTQGHIIAPSTKPEGAHPFWKPGQVWEPLIAAVATPGDKIMDPFAGEGSSVRAIINARCEPILIEKNEEHIPRLLETTLNSYKEWIASNRS